MLRRDLSREWLNNQDITIERDGRGYKFYHITKFRGVQELHPCINCKKHPHGKDMYYYMLGWYNSKEHKQYVFPVHRVVFAYFNDGVDNYYDVDHINGNTLDNSLENLKMITHKENLRKRSCSGPNQYKNSVKG